jgi:hypothetical protein
MGLDQFFRRPQQVGTFTITPSGITSSTFPANIFQLWAALPQVANKLAGYKFFRGDLTVTIVYTGSSQALGCTNVGFFPIAGLTNNTFGSTQTYPSWFTDSLSAANVWEYSFLQLPGVMICHEQAATCDISLPFPSASPYISIPSSSDSSYGDWECNVMAINLLKNVTGTTPTNMPVQVFAHYDHVQLFGACVPQGDEGGGPISGALSYASEFLSFGGSVFPFLTPWSMIAKGASGVAAALGFSKPPNVEVMAMTPYDVSSLSAMSGQQDFSFRLALDPRSAVDVTKADIPLATSKDMEITTFTRRWSHIANAQFAATGGTSYPVFPTACMSTLYATQFPTCFYPALFFRYYTGSIEYRFEFIANPFVRATIGIVYVPYGGVVPSSYTDASATVCKRQIVTVIGRTVVDFTCPYTYPTYNRLIGGVYSTFPKVDSAIPTLSPQIILFLITPATSQFGVPIGLEYNLSVRGGPDFCYMIPRTIPGQLRPWTVGASVGLPGVYPEGKEDSGMDGVSEPTQNPLPIMLYGEQVFSLGTLFKRSCLMAALTSPAVNTLLAIPFWGYHANASPATSTATTFIVGFAPCFYACRGGMRYKFVYPEELGNFSVFSSLVQAAAPTSVFTLLSGLPAFYSSDGAAWSSNKSRGMFEIEMPSREYARFREAWRMGGVATGHSAAGESLLFGAPVLATRTCNVYQSAADDFTLYGFLCVPPMILNDTIS